MENIITMIAELGFPIAITAYLLLRIENQLSHLTEAVVELKESIMQHRYQQEKTA